MYIFIQCRCSFVNSGNFVLRVTLREVKKTKAFIVLVTDKKNRKKICFWFPTEESP